MSYKCTNAIKVILTTRNNDKLRNEYQCYLFFNSYIPFHLSRTNTGTTRYAVPFVNLFDPMQSMAHGKKDGHYFNFTVTAIKIVRYERTSYIH